MYSRLAYSEIRKSPFILCYYGGDGKLNEDNIWAIQFASHQRYLIGVFVDDNKKTIRWFLQRIFVIGDFVENSHHWI